jgi:hypothetical protein
MRDLKALEDKGYLTKEKRGRSNVYHLREKIEIKDAAGRPTAVATWDYLPGFGRLDSANLAGLPGNDKTLARQIRTENLSSGPGFGQFGERNPGETAGLAVRDPTQGLSKGKTAEPELAADLPESLYETKR